MATPRRVIADSDDEDSPTQISSAPGSAAAPSSASGSSSAPTAALAPSDSEVPLTSFYANGDSTAASGSVAGVGAKRQASAGPSDQPAAKKPSTAAGPTLIPKKEPAVGLIPKKEPKTEPKTEPMDTTPVSPSAKSTSGSKRQVRQDDDDDDDSDDDGSPDEAVPAKRARTKAPATPVGRSPRAAATKKKPVYKDASSDDDDFLSENDSSEDEFATTKSGQTKAKKKPAAAAAKKSPAKAKKTAAAAKKKPAAAAAKKAPAKKSTAAKKTPSKRGAAQKKKNEAAKKEAAKKKEAKPEEPVYKWWLHEDEEDPLPEGHKWRTLEHNGVVFAPPYVKHNVKMLYDGKPIELDEASEEVATLFAVTMGTDHATNPVFCKNFFKDWLPILNKGRPKSNPHPIKKFDLCDFRPIHAHLVAQREAKKIRPKEDRDKEKAAREAIQAKYGHAIVDGVKQDVGNFNIEPPNLFRGRGAHPKTGMLKQRVLPEQVVINIGKEAKVPEPPAGHKWKEVRHDPEVTWLAMWRENINQAFKYVHLGTSSKIKQMSDRDKFEKARKLKDCIDDIRTTYERELTDTSVFVRQRATAMYLIDKLALRAGNEKDGDEEADTVGCCSLRVEHVDLSVQNRVKLDFLGKDSMRYENEVDVPEKVFKNLRLFLAKKDKETRKVSPKKPGDDLFDLLDTNKLNKHLRDLMPGLSAKVFRTYNASITLQQELDKMPPKLDTNAKVVFYNDANREVAILCNHQRTIPKSHGAALERMDAKIEQLKQEVKWLKAGSKAIKDGKTPPTHKVTKINRETKKEEKVPYKYPKTVEACKTRITALNKRIAHQTANRTIKDKLSDVSLSTSKINYMDPRISAAWCTKHDVELKRVFNASLMKKFPWAMDVGADWVF